MHSSGLRLGYVAGFLGALALAGCGSSKPKDGYASLAWDIFDIEDVNGVTSLACGPVGAATVVVTLMNQGTGDVYTQLPVNCTDYQMSTALVPSGSYTVGLDLYGDPAIYGDSTTLLDSFDVTGTFHLGGGLNDFRSPVSPFLVKRFVVDWGVYRSGAPSTCAGVPAATYADLEFLPNTGTSWVSNPFDCTAGSGASYAIPYGNASPSALTTSAQWQMLLLDSVDKTLTSLPGGTVGVPASTNVYLATQYFSL
jgi:hypothetical protein